MKRIITKQREYDIPEGNLCAHLLVSGFDVIVTCTALKKGVWFDSDGFPEDTFECRAFDEDIPDRIHKDAHVFPCKIKKCKELKSL